AKTRPTWMVAVTALALVAAVVLVFFAIKAMNKSDEDTKAKEEAQKIAEQAVKDAKEAQEQAEKLQRDAEEMNKQTMAAVADVATKKEKADIEAAQARLAALQKAQAEMNARIAEAKAKADRAERLKGVKIKQECLDNPLAKGCS